jgi:hypothetical protein
MTRRRREPHPLPRSTLPAAVAIKIAEQPRSDAGETADVVMRLAAPLPAGNRSAFLQAVAAEFAQGKDGIGPGAVHRIARELQRQYLMPGLAGATLHPASGSTDADSTPNPSRNRRGVTVPGKSGGVTGRAGQRSPLKKELPRMGTGKV